MADFKEVPTPTYEREISRLVSYYDKAIKDIRRYLDRTDINNLQRAQARATLSSIVRTLKELDEKAIEWTSENVELATKDGAAKTLVSLGEAATMEEARKIVSFNTLNAALIETAVSDLQDDLMQISTNIERKVRNSIREVTAEVMRSNLTRGVNGRRTMSADIYNGLREKLGNAVNTGIVDASNRRWNPKVYAEMLTRTKMAATQRESARNEAIERGAYYGVISRHNAIDACRNYEGKIVKLSPEAEGPYPYIDNLPRREIFHPNCRHSVSPVRDPALLPQNLREINDVDDNQTLNNDRQKPLRELNNVEEIERRGGKVIAGDTALSEIYGSNDMETVELRLAEQTKDALGGRYRGTASAHAYLRNNWVDDNTNPTGLAIENFFAGKFGLDDYKVKSPKKLTNRESAVMEHMNKQAIDKLKSEGITHVKVYRGVTWEQGNSWLPKDTNNMKLDGRALTSWTMRKQVAREYADYADDWELYGTKVQYGGVMEAVIPVEKVGFTGIVGYADEVTVVGDIEGVNMVAKKRGGSRWLDE